MENDAHIEEGEIVTAMPHGLRALWREACAWAVWLFGAIDIAALRGPGVDRTFGARISGWLMQAEASVRRLILAAALAATPVTTQRDAVRPVASRVRPASRRGFRVFGFRVFGLRGAGVSRPAPPRPPQPFRPYAHIIFPADPLLSLGARPPESEPRRFLWRRPNPIDRWGRLSRRDPDWRPPEERWRPEQADGIMSFVHREPAPYRERKPRTPYDPDAMPESAWDWRRCHEEWQKLVPAPHLAGRIEALQRVMADPTRAITNSARRLHRSQSLARASMRHAIPPSRYPRRAAHLDRGGRLPDFSETCHDALVRCVTS